MLENYALVGRFRFENHQSVCANLAGANNHALHTLGLVVRCALRSKKGNDVEGFRGLLTDLKNI